MAWVWKHGPKDPTERMVLLAIADHCDGEGRAHPSMAGIAAKACLSERGARNVVRRLEAGGWLKTKVGGGRGGRSHYLVVMRENPEQETRNKKPGKTNPEPESDKPGTWRPETRNLRSAEPSITTKEPSKSNAREAREALDALCAVMRRETAEAFIAHRKAKRSALTAKAAELIAKKLAGHPSPDAVIEDSIANGWTGVFPEKHQPRPQPANVTPFRLTDIDISKFNEDGSLKRFS